MDNHNHNEQKDNLATIVEAGKNALQGNRA